MAAILCIVGVNDFNLTSNSSCKLLRRLVSAAIDDNRLEGVFDLSSARASAFESLDDLQAVGVCNLAEDDVLAIEPGSNDGGDEELGAVATGRQ